MTAQRAAFVALLLSSTALGSVSWTWRSDGLWQGTPSTPVQIVLATAALPAAIVTIPRLHVFRGLHLRWIAGTMTANSGWIAGHFGDVVAGSFLAIGINGESTVVYPNATSDPRLQISGIQYTVSGVDLLLATTLDMFTAPIVVQPGTQVYLWYRHTDYTLAVGNATYEISFLVSTKPSLSHSFSNDITQSRSFSQERTRSVSISKSFASASSSTSLARTRSASVSGPVTLTSTRFPSPSTTQQRTGSKSVSPTLTNSSTPPPTPTPTQGATGTTSQTKTNTDPSATHTVTEDSTVTRTCTVTDTGEITPTQTPSISRTVTRLHTFSSSQPKSVSLSEHNVTLSKHVTASTATAFLGTMTLTSAFSSSTTPSGDLTLSVTATSSYEDPLINATIFEALFPGVFWQSALGATVGITAVLAPFSPSTVLHAVRTFLLLSIASGDHDAAARLPFPISPWPSFGFGPAEGFYVRGAIVAHLLSLFGITFVLFWIAAFMGSAAVRDQPQLYNYMLVAGCNKAKFPGSMVVVLGLLVPGLVSTSMMAACHAVTSFDVIIAVFGLFVSSVLVISCILATNFMPLRLAVVDHAYLHGEWYRERYGYPTLWHEKDDDHSEVVPFRAFSWFFASYRATARWYFAWDLSSATIAAFGHGMLTRSGGDDTGSALVLTLVGCLSGVDLFLQRKLRPQVILRLCRLQCAATILTVTAAALFVVARFGYTYNLRSLAQLAALLSVCSALTCATIAVRRQLKVECVQRRRRPTEPFTANEGESPGIERLVKKRRWKSSSTVTTAKDFEMQPTILDEADHEEGLTPSTEDNEIKDPKHHLRTPYGMEEEDEILSRRNADLTKPPNLVVGLHIDPFDADETAVEILSSEAA